MTKRLTLAAALAAALAALPPAPARAAKLFAVSAQYESSNGVVYRYDVNGPDDRPTAPDLVLTIGQGWPDSSPAAVAFSPWGELFVMDRGPYGNGGAAGAVFRYLDPAGPAPIPHGTISSGGSLAFATPHWGDFRGNELFVAQRYAVVERLVVDPAGGAVHAGQIPISGWDSPRGVKVAPWGELFVTQLGDPAILRFLVAADGAAVPNGAIPHGDHGLSNPHDLAFAPWGEAFVASGATSRIVRYTFDASGAAVWSGEIADPSLYGAIGITYAPWGELFVSHHERNEITRWIVGPGGAFQPNGSIATPVGPVSWWWGTVAGLGDVEILAPQAPVAACAPPPAGLVGWWAGEGDAADAAGALDGTLVGTVGFVPAAVGQGFAFPGEGDGVLLPRDPALELQDFTIDAWIKRDRLDLAGSGPSDEGEILVYGQEGYGLGLEANGSLFLTQVGWSNVQSGPGTIADTDFHHVAVTKQGDRVVFYVDGAAVAARSYPVTFNFYTPASIGNRGDAIGPGATVEPFWHANFFGVIDEVDVFSRALAPAEVWRIHQAGAVGKCRAIAVAVDVKPGDAANAVNPLRTANLPVAVLATPAFDPGSIDLATVRFGATGTEVAPTRSTRSDVDLDGDLDLLLQFDARAAGIACGATSVALTGRTTVGHSVAGGDSIRTVGCR